VSLPQVAIEKQEQKRIGWVGPGVSPGVGSGVSQGVWAQG
jgi:hypothetical protein